MKARPRGSRLCHFRHWQTGRLLESEVESASVFRCLQVCHACVTRAARELPL